MSEENKINPKAYYYPTESTVEIPGGFLTELMVMTEQLLEKQIKTESEFKFNYVTDKGKIVKTFKQEDVESGKVKKVLDWQRTVEEPNFKHSLTEEGIKYAKLKNFLENLHMENIEKGIAVTHIKSA